MATYVNNLRLTELATGEGSGTWGTTTNTSLELIGEALGYNTQDCFTTDANATTTVADGATDPARAFYFKVTSSATLTATRTLTIAPNTISRVMFIENATTGSQSITISQGSGANVTIATGRTAVVYLDGAGSTAAVVNAMANVDPGVTDTLAEVLVAGNTSGGTNIQLTTTDEVQFRDTALKISSSADGQLDIDADTELEVTAPTVDINASTAVLISNDLKLDSDSAVLGFGADNDVTLTHIADTALRLNASRALQFRDSAISISSSTDGQLDIDADNEVEITTTTLDLNGILDVSGNTTLGADVTFTGASYNAVWDSSDNALEFADNAKAIFGAGSDLQIYHSSSSFIRELGSGGLYIDSDGGHVTVRVNASEKAIEALNNGAVNLYYDNAEKLATTSAGIDVTGTVTADGLTVDGNATISGDSNGLRLTETDTTDLNSYITNQAGTLRFRSANDAYNSFTTRLQVDHATGDISFFEDTGTTAKFFWDSSAESLGIGVGTPQASLHIVNDASTTQFIASGTVGNDRFLAIDVDISGLNDVAYITVDQADSLAFGEKLNDNDRAIENEWMRIDSSGNVGIGTTSPASLLNVQRNGTTVSSGLDSQTAATFQSTGATGSSTHVNILAGSTGSTGQAVLTFGDADDPDIGRITYRNGDNSMAFTTNTSEAMRINSSGNVGVGTTSIDSGSKLHVRESDASLAAATGASVALFERAGNAGITIGTANDGDSTLFFGDPDSMTIGRVNYDHSDNSLQLWSNSAERMRIDSAGEVGIGTSTVNANLHVHATSAAKIWITAAGSNPSDAGSLRFAELNNGGNYFEFAHNGSANTLTLTSANGDIVTFDRNNQRVGINTSSPATTLTVEGSSANGIELNRNGVDAASSARLFFDSSTNCSSLFNSGGNFIIATGATPGSASGTERFRVTSGGNLLVGKTGTGIAEDGIALVPDGDSAITRSGGSVLYLNRNDSDGVILNLRKDNSTVGEIGTLTISATSRFAVGSGDVRLLFRPDIEAVQPASDSGVRDASITLGNSVSRFKDLYLSGGAYLGGTAAANLLDDYEEGTFTPELADASSGGNTGTATTFEGRYTKVGRQIVIVIKIEDVDTTGMTGANNIFIRGLPFTAGSGTTGQSQGSLRLDRVDLDANCCGIVSSTTSNSTYLTLRQTVDNSADVQIKVQDFTSGSSDIFTTITYFE